MSDAKATRAAPPVPPAPVVAPPSMQEVPPPAEVKTEAVLQLITPYPLQDPDTGLWFLEGQSVQVPRITKWMQYQMDAGIMVQV